MAMRMSEAIRIAMGKPRRTCTHVVRLPGGWVRRVNWDGSLSLTAIDNWARPYSLAGATDVAKRHGGTVEPWIGA